MQDRRQFLRASVYGTVLLGLEGQPALAAAGLLGGHGGSKDKFSRHIDPALSRVVVARDAALHSASGDLNEQRVLDLLDRAIAAYTGHDKAMEGWRRILPAGASEKVIGLKVNGGGGKGIATHGALVLAVAERLQQAGVKVGNIVAWDRDTRDVEACGLTINPDPARMRCVGSELFGYEEAPVADEPITYGAAANARLARILTRDCDMVIGLPFLTDHSTAGVSFAMKNACGAVAHPEELDGHGFNPGIADLNMVPVIRQKMCFTIGDALTSIYDGGPVAGAASLWRSNALIVAEDRVAADYTAWQMIERKRSQAGLPTLEAAGRAPLYIATAADEGHHLGFNQPSQIDLVEL